MRACTCACWVGRPSSTFLHLVHSCTGIGVTHSHGEMLHGSHACGTQAHIRARVSLAAGPKLLPGADAQTHSLRPRGPSHHFHPLHSLPRECPQDMRQTSLLACQGHVGVLALGWLVVRKTPRPQLPSSIWGMGPGGGGGGWTPWAQKVGSQWSRPGVFPGEPAPLPALMWVSLRRGPSTQQGHLLLTWDQQAMELCPLDVVGPLP